MTLRVTSQFLQSRLRSVLQAALKAPGNWPRFQQGGLLQSRPSPSAPPILIDHWQERFTNLPILEKAAIRQTPGQFLAGVEDIVYRGSTSGSRSRSYTFFAGTPWNQRRLQSRQFFLDWWGIDSATPIVNVASRLMPGRSVDWAIAGPVDEACITSLQALLARQPSVVRGYPSRLCAVASHLFHPLPPLKAVIGTGEPLFQHQRELLERVFQAPVINEYGCHEAAIRGFACPEGGRIHLDEQSCWLEIVEGSLVTTDLWNETMPLIRYRCGDVVHRHDSPCPCGRPGLTVTVLGRVEDQIGTCQGSKMPGEVEMPALPGILHYQIQRQFPALVLARVQGDASFSAQPADVPERALRSWVTTTFGEGQLSITHASTAAVQNREEAWSDRQWLQAITQESLAAWVHSTAMPTGEARPLARVLRLLVAPHILGAELPVTTQQRIVALAASAAAADPAVERMKVRLLLLACSCTRDRHLSEAIYGKAVLRLQGQSPAPSAAITLDRLLPALHLPSRAATLAHRPVTIAETWSPDPLTVQHLLAAFDMALQRRSPPQRPSVLQQLHPALAVLVGDLTFWAANLTLEHLQHWADLLGGPSIATPPPRRCPQQSAFLSAWLQWRQALLHQPTQAGATFKALQAAAVTDAEIARFHLERGYFDIVRGVPLAPQEWLSIIASTTRIAPGNLESTADLTPWLPIVRALVQPLHHQGQLDLAYRCLLAASFTSRQQSAFERLTTAFNQKQSVLIDLCPSPRPSPRMEP